MDFKIKSNCRGTTMVEAAVVFPLVIMAIISIIFILAFMFQQVWTNSSIHIAINETMGRETGTVEAYSKVPHDVDVYKSPGGAAGTYRGGKKISMVGQGILAGSFAKDKEGSVYVVDEKKWILYKDFFTDF